MNVLEWVQEQVICKFFKPFIFNLESDLDVLPDERRHYFLDFDYPSQTVDECTLHYNPNEYKLETACKVFNQDYKISSFKVRVGVEEPGTIKLERNFALKSYSIDVLQYEYYRNIHKLIAESNEENMVMKHL